MYLDDDNQRNPIHRYFLCLLSQTKKGGIAIQEGCINYCSQIDTGYLCYADTMENFLSTTEFTIVDCYPQIFNLCEYAFFQSVIIKNN
jgi:hypothetical protein